MPRLFSRAVAIAIAMALAASPANAEDCPTSIAKTLPPGWPCERVETRPSWAMVGGGVALFALGYVPMVIYGAGDLAGHETAAVPVVGPFVAAAKRDAEERRDPRGPSGAAWAAFGGIAVLQSVGLVLAIAGVLSNDSRFVPVKRGHPAVSAGATRDGAHVSFMTTF